jgi:hypothetical protein
VQDERKFLPPLPPGPEPELGGRPAGARPQATGSSPSPPAVAPGWQQPGVPGWQGPTHDRQAPAGWPPPAAPWTYSPGAAVPDNGQAVAGFVLSLVAGGLLVLSFGVSSIVSIACAAFGIVYSRKGRTKVDAGETPKHRGLAQAGFITGIVVVVLSVLATAFWLLILILYLTNDQFHDDLQRELDNPNTVSAMLHFGLAVIRLGARLLG